MNLYFDFYGITFALSSEDELLLHKLSQDFSYFKREEILSPLYMIEILQNFNSDNIIPPLVSKRISQNSITYETPNSRYNDYHGKVLTVLNKKKGHVSVYPKDPQKTHEVLYLMILSLSGKKLEHKGLHKLHSCGVVINNRIQLFAMPMKGGKTTLFLELLTINNSLIISDDTPLIDKVGRVYSFPIRTGTDSIDPSLSKRLDINETLLYAIEREQYGKKDLIPLSAFKNKVNKDYDLPINLFIGKRSSHSDCRIQPISKLRTLVGLMEHMVVGTGLPIILEYFLNLNFKDLFELPFLFMKRLRAATNLLIKADCYEIYLSNDIPKNVQAIRNFLKV